MPRFIPITSIASDEDCETLETDIFFMHVLSRDDDNPRRVNKFRSTDVYDTHNIEHRTEPFSH